MKIKLTKSNLYNDKLLCIRSIRQITGAGLQEAKQLIERALNGKEIRLEVVCTDGQLMKQAVSDLESIGFTVTTTSSPIFEQLKKITCSATQENNFQVAEQLITILKGVS